MDKLESTLNEWFVKKAPFQLPVNGKKLLVQWLPWVNLLVGLVATLGALAAYQALMLAYSAGGAVHDVYAAYYGVTTPVVSSYAIGPLAWLSLGVLVIEIVILFAAFPGLRMRKKSGWNLLFWSALLNVAYSLIYLFANQNIGGFISSAIGTIIGLYLLFQIRSSYTGKRTKASR